MAKFPALPLWTDALLADTGHLSDQEFGTYIRLLILIWRSPQCRIPNDEKWLCKRIANALPLQNEFCVSDGNWITQKRLLREWKYVRAKSQKNSASAKARWKKEKHKSERTDLASITHSERNAPTPTPTPTPTPEESKKETLRASREVCLLPDWLPRETWEAFIEMRSKSRSKLTEHGKHLTILKLGKLRDEGHDPRAMLEQSIMRGWRGVFPVEADRTVAPTEKKEFKLLKLPETGAAR